mmetsp:Transcript_62670/g.130021  ORF Transcript_62670/g.130021 Transcript_62670/m.130021 type:complete len:300 (+) Transcript_62670:393-1292(+)
MAVELEVRVHIESGLHRSTGHNHLLDGFFPRRRLRLSLVVVLVLFEILVRGLGGGITLRRSRGRLRLWAALGALGGVRILAPGTMVVAMWQREIAAKARAEGTCSLVLAATHSTGVLDVLPWCINLATIATIRVGIEAHILGRDGDHRLALRCNAHSVRGSFSPCEGPAAATVRLVADVIDHLLTLRPLCCRVEILRDISVHLCDEAVDFSPLHRRLDGLRRVAFHAAKAPGGPRGLRGKTLHGTRGPGNSWSALDFCNHGRPIGMHLQGCNAQKAQTKVQRPIHDECQGGKSEVLSCS